MREMTKLNLANAFSGESQAHMKYLIFSDKAEKEGKVNIARLFKAIAYAEQVHATNHFKTLEELGDTKENLERAISGENFEVNEMYPAYDAVANLQSEKQAVKSIHYAIEAEKIHEKLYSEAREAVTKGQDIDIEKVYVCPICGYTVVGNAPDVCPICGTKKELFKEF